MPREGPYSGLPPIHRRRVDDSFLVNDDFSIAIDGPEEARWVTFVASCAGLLDGEEDGIGVTIDADLEDFLSMAAFFAFSPKFPAAAAEVGSHTGLQRFLEGLLVHPGEHEDLSGGGILGDGWEEAAGEVEIGYWGSWLVHKNEYNSCGLPALDVSCAGR